MTTVRITVAAMMLAACSGSTQTQDSSEGSGEQRAGAAAEFHDVSNVAPPKAAKTDVEEVTEYASSNAYGLTSHTRLQTPFSPDIDEALLLAGQTADNADVDYEMQLLKLRGKAAENSALLRRRLPAVPQREFELRQRVLSMIGDLAATKEDASVLREHALRKMAEHGSAARDEHDPAFLLEQDEDALAWMGMFSLAKFTRRNEADAQDALRAVLERADRKIAFGLAVELQEAGLYRSEHEEVLQARGIRSSYVMPKEPQALKVEADDPHVSGRSPAPPPFKP